MTGFRLTRSPMVPWTLAVLVACSRDPATPTADPTLGSDDPSTAPATAPATEVPPATPEGDVWAGMVDGSRFFVSGGTSVGSFELCEGPVTAWVTESTVSADLSCTFEDERTCEGLVRDAPIAGPWPATWRCDGVDIDSAAEVTSTPPEGLEASDVFEWPLDQGGYFAVAMDITAILSE